MTDKLAAIATVRAMLDELEEAETKRQHWLAVHDSFTKGDSQHNCTTCTHFTPGFECWTGGTNAQCTYGGLKHGNVQMSNYYASVAKCAMWEGKETTA